MAIPRLVGSRPALSDAPPPCPSRPDGRHEFGEVDVICIGDLGWIDPDDDCHTNVFGACTCSACGTVRVHAGIVHAKRSSQRGRQDSARDRPGLLLGFAAPGADLSADPGAAVDAAR